MLLKGSLTAQGNSLGSLAAASKKVVTGTGTLFGGRAQDIYYLLWRLFPRDMVKAGYKFEEVTKFNEEFGNIEETFYEGKSSSEYSNTNSRGGETRSSKKVVPGISPFIYGKFMVHNVINVRLKDVWPDPVDLIDTPTIMIPMDEELRKNYNEMIRYFESAIDSLDNGHTLYLKMTDYGIAYPDNPFSFPDAYCKGELENPLVWKAKHLNTDSTLNKEKKLQEIIESEISEGRKAIVYVRDTGSSVSERDIRPRLKKKLEEVGAKVIILDTGTTTTDNRSDWLKKKIEEEDYDVCIVSQELVKVGLDLLCTPTIIYYQFSWSLFTINQSSRRAWRIGQTEECRLFYLAYENSYQEHMAKIIAQKNKATAAINGEVSTDGLSAMLGDEGDLQSMLIESVKKGGENLKGSAEEWISQTSDRARELLNGIGKKKKPKALTIDEQFTAWIYAEITGETTKAVMLRDKDKLVKNILDNLVPGFECKNNVLVVDLIEAFGFDRSFISDGAILYHIAKPQQAPSATKADKNNTDSEITVIEFTKVEASNKRKSKKNVINDNQLSFDLFA